jgi:hypothetical protein
VAVMPEAFGSHPVVACAERLGHELDEIAAVPVEYMAAEEKADALTSSSTGVADGASVEGWLRPSAGVRLG